MANTLLLMNKITNLPDIDPLIERIEKELEARNLKKTWFCHKMDITTQNYNNWRHRGIPANRLNDVAQTMKWPLHMVFEGINADPADNPIARDEIIRIISRLLDHQLSAYHQTMSTSVRVGVIIHLFELLQDSELRDFIANASTATLEKLLKMT